MMEQYIEIKAANPDCLLFYRMGDFYELFFEDAEIASRALGIVLTKRGKHLGRDIPMCGVPIDRADEYLHRLIALGHRVAVCEQLEDPAEAKKRGGKSVVRRDVVRLVTPGTLTEDTLLDARRNNYLLAIARARVSSPDDESRFALGLDRHFDRRIPHRRMRPRGPRSPPRSRGSSRARSSSRTRFMAMPSSAPFWRSLPAVTPLARDVFDGATAERRLASYLRRRDHAKPSARCRGSSSTAAAACVTYVERTQLGKRPPLSPPLRESAGATHGDRSGDARQSRTDAHALRRAARLAARGHRPHGDLGRLAPAGAAACGAADRPGRHRAPARRRGRCSSTDAARARRYARAAARRRPISPARWRGWRSAAAARAISPPSATASRAAAALAARSTRCTDAARRDRAKRCSALRRPDADAGRRAGRGARRRTAAVQARRRLRARGLRRRARRGARACATNRAG